MKHRLPNFKSENYNGPLLSWSQIPVLRSKNLRILPEMPGGDAPKRLVRIYEYEEDSSVRRDNVHSWPVYIAKTAEKWHPIESVTEYLINLSGLALDLTMNDFRLYQQDGSIWFCSRYFLNQRAGEALIHGTEICGDYLEDREFAKGIADNIKDARELFTFDFITESVSALFPDRSRQLMDDLFKILMFDCLLGNNDRHFYNWAIVMNVKRNLLLGVAPVYDSARGLFWNVPDTTIMRKSNGRGGLDAYIEKYASNTKPRMTCENNKDVNHFGLIQHVTSSDPRFRLIAQEMSTEDYEHAVVQTLTHAAMPFFSAYRISAITKLITLRFHLTRQAIQ